VAFQPISKVRKVKLILYLIYRYLSSSKNYLGKERLVLLSEHYQDTAIQTYISSVKSEFWHVRLLDLPNSIARVMFVLPSLIKTNILAWRYAKGDKDVA
jgi:hypothetical protein